MLKLFSLQPLNILGIYFYWWHFCWMSLFRRQPVFPVKPSVGFIMCSSLIFWSFIWVYLDMNLFYLTILDNFSIWKILSLILKKKKHCFFFSNMHLAILSYFLLELLIRWVFESLNFHTCFLIALSFLKPYLGELLRGSLNFAGYFFDISSLKDILFFNEYIFHSQYFWLVFHICLFLSQVFRKILSASLSLFIFFTYSGLQTYWLYPTYVVLYLWFVCNTCCLTIGICGYLS